MAGAPTNPRSLDVLGMGNSCLDTWLELERWPDPGAAVRVGDHRCLAGGQIASALVGCCRLGLRCGFLLRTGDDEAGRCQRRALRAAGVGLRHARVVAGVPSATACILHAPGGERAVIWHTDPRLCVAPGDLNRVDFAAVRVLLIDGGDPASVTAAARAQAAGAAVVADCDASYPHTRALLRHVDHLIAPAEYLRAIAGGRRARPAPIARRLRAGRRGPRSEPSPSGWRAIGALGPAPIIDAAALRAVAAHGPAVVVATEGARGATAWHAGRLLHDPALPVDVVDTTGAGDAFHAGYIYALLAGWPLPQRLRFANATAALACTAVGAQAGMPDRARVEALLARHSRARARRRA